MITPLAVAAHAAIPATQMAQIFAVALSNGLHAGEEHGLWTPAGPADRWVRSAKRQRMAIVPASWSRSFASASAPTSQLPPASRLRSPLTGGLITVEI